MFGGDRHRPVQPRVYRVVGRLERQHQQPATNGRAGIQQRLGRIQQPAVGRVQPRLSDRPGRGDRGGPVVKHHGHRDLPSRTVLQPHPRLGDDAKRPLGPEEQPVGDGPAPLPGSRRDSLIPTGVTIRSDSVKSSIWV